MSSSSCFIRFKVSQLSVKEYNFVRPDSCVYWKLIFPFTLPPPCVFQTNRYSFNIRKKTVCLSTRNFPFRWSHWPRGVGYESAAPCYLGLWVRIPPAAWMSVFVSVVRCQVVASVRGRSLIQMSPTECVVSECDREASTTRRSWPIGGCYAMGGKK